MPYPLLAMGLSAGLGALGNYLGSRKGSRTSEIDQTTTGSSTTDINFLDELMPLLTDGQGRLQKGLLSEVLNQLFRPETSTDNLITEGIFNINQGADANKISLSRSLASRGLSRSPAASSAIAGAEGNRISQITQLRNQAPIMADQLRQQNLSLAGQIFGAQPFGQRTTRTGSTTTNTSSRTKGTNVGAGSALGSGLGGFGSILAYLTGQGMLGGGGGNSNKGGGNSNKGGGRSVVPGSDLLNFSQLFGGGN